MRLKKHELPAVGEGCKPVHMSVGIFKKTDFCFCKAHSYLQLNTCENCGMYFHTQRKHSKTCSDACRKALSRKVKMWGKDHPPIMIITHKSGMRIVQNILDSAVR